MSYLAKAVISCVAFSNFCIRASHHSAQKILVLWHKRLYDAAEPIVEGLKVGEGKRLTDSLVHPA